MIIFNMCLNEFILATNDRLTRLKKQFSTKYRQHISTSFAYCQNLTLWDARQQTHLNRQPDDTGTFVSCGYHDKVLVMQTEMAILLQQHEPE